MSEGEGAGAVGRWARLVLLAVLVAVNPGSHDRTE
jgi:hypothetical protein